MAAIMIALNVVLVAIICYSFLSLSQDFGVCRISAAGRTGMPL
jgi:hypothetical protein